MTGNYRSPAVIRSPGTRNKKNTIRIYLALSVWYITLTKTKLIDDDEYKDTGLKDTDLKMVPIHDEIMVTQIFKETLSEKKPNKLST